MMQNNIVVTMAGRGSRFREAGYLIPKYEIIAHDKSLFDWSLLSLTNFIDSDTRIIFVCLKENNSREFVLTRCRSLGLINVHFLELDQVTDGQATSAYLSRHLWLQERPLLIFNIDTYIHPNLLRPECIPPKSDGWIPCFQASGEHWSFVKLGADGWASSVSEKIRISNFASVGLYWFRTANLFSSAYTSFFSDINLISSGERYVAPVYNRLIMDKRLISISNLSLKDIHVLGTPSELNKFLEEKRLFISKGLSD